MTLAGQTVRSASTYWRRAEYGQLASAAQPSVQRPALPAGALASVKWTSEPKELARRHGTKARYTHVTLGYIHHQPEAANDGWFIECELPTDTLRAIASAVSSGTLRAMTIGLALKEVYSDDWSRPSALTDWFLKPDVKGGANGTPQMAHGDMTRLSFDLVSVDLRRPSGAPPEQSEFQDTIRG